MGRLKCDNTECVHPERHACIHAGERPVVCEYVYVAKPKRRSDAFKQL